LDTASSLEAVGKNRVRRGQHEHLKQRLAVADDARFFLPTAIALSGQAKVFYAAQDRLKMTICYCSVYDECWIANREEPKTQKVDRCESSGTVQFEEKL
jgi:hypothetical protein